MPIEHINKTDTLNEGREKINDAIDGANAADVTSKAADTKATQALTNSESTQTQLDTIVIDGDSSVEAAQARVDEKGVSHPTLKARIDDGMNSVNQQLAQIAYVNIKTLGAVGDGVTDDSNAIQIGEDLGVNIYFPDGVYNIENYIVKKNSNWLGQSHDTILLLGNGFNYNDEGDTSPVPRYAISTEHYNELETANANEFTIDNITFKFRVTEDIAGNGSFNFFLIGNTKNIILKNLFLDSDNMFNIPHTVIDVRKSTYGVIFENNKGIHDATGNYGNLFMVRNFSVDRETHDVIIRNNNFIKKHGGDEVIWINANSNLINNIHVYNNLFETSSRHGLFDQASPLYIMSGIPASYATDKAYCSNVYIEKNVFKCTNLAYSVIHVGRDNQVKDINRVVVRDNLIDCKTSFGSVEEVYASGISVRYVDDSIVENNVIKGNYWRAIFGGDNVFNNRITITNSQNCIVTCEVARDNVIDSDTTGSIFTNTTKILDNFIESNNTLASYRGSGIFHIEGNTYLQKEGENVSRVIDVISSDEDIVDGVNLILRGNIFKVNGGNFINGLSKVYAYNNQIVGISTLAPYGNVKSIDSNTYTLDGEKYSDTLMDISDMEIADIPWGIRNSSPIGTIIQDINTPACFIKTGTTTNSWSRLDNRFDFI